MQLEDYFDLQGDNIIRLKGHRIGLEHLLAYYQEGYTPDQIAGEFPGVTLEQVYAAIMYYLTHRVEVERYLMHTQDRAEQDYLAFLAHPSPLSQRLKAVRQQRLGVAV
jgi:uncharacterized protein (DUF433 family)